MPVAVYCPFCGGKCITRSSERPSLLTVKASLHCQNCGTLKADFIGQITNVRKAVFVDCEEVKGWTKTEREQVREDGKKTLTNEERLAQLRAGKLQPDLFVKEEAEKKPEHR